MRYLLCGLVLCASVARASFFYSSPSTAATPFSWDDVIPQYPSLLVGYVFTNGLDMTNGVYIDHGAGGNGSTQSTAGYRPTFHNDQHGPYVEFDEADDIIDVPTNAAPLNNVCTLMILGRHGPLGASDYDGHITARASDNKLYTLLSCDDDTKARVYDGSSYPVDLQRDMLHWNEAEWKVLALTYTQNLARCYEDGSMYRLGAKFEDTSCDVQLSNVTTRYAIGYYWSASWRSDWDYKAAFVWDYALSSNEVETFSEFLLTNQVVYPGYIDQKASELTDIWYLQNGYTDAIAGNDFTVTSGTPTFPIIGTNSNGRVQYALDLDSGEYVTAGAGRALNTASAWSILFWANTTADGHVLGDASETDWVALLTASDDFQIRTLSASSIYTYTWSNISLPDSGWHHYALSNDGTDCSLYVDGEVQATTYNMTSYLDISTIGKGGAGTNFVGQINDVRIYMEGLESNAVYEVYRWTYPTNSIEVLQETQATGHT